MSLKRNRDGVILPVVCDLSVGLLLPPQFAEQIDLEQADPLVLRLHLVSNLNGNFEGPMDCLNGLVAMGILGTVIADYDNAGTLFVERIKGAPLALGIHYAYVDIGPFCQPSYPGNPGHRSGRREGLPTS